MVETGPLNPQKGPRVGAVTLILRIKKSNLAEVKRPSKWDGKAGSRSGLPVVSLRPTHSSLSVVCASVCVGGGRRREVQLP